MQINIENPFKSLFKTKSAPAIIPQQEDFRGLGSSLPKWLNLENDLDFMRCWTHNPILRGIIEIRAKAKSNVRLLVKDLKSGEYLDSNSRKRPDAKPLLDLLKQPNPLQTYKEWLFMSEVNYAIFGNSYDYGTLPIGFNDFNYKNVTSIKQLPPYLTTYELTDFYFDQIAIENIIKSYYLHVGIGNPRAIAPKQIMHKSETNIKFDMFFLKGVSKLKGLRQPLSNIEMAFESRNVIMRKRGALGVFSSDMKDANGMLPMLPDQTKQVQDSFAKYGTLEDQYQYIISPIPIKYQKTTLNIDELKLFEEVASDAMLICNSYGVPEILAKLYLAGATFENQEASERRLYNDTIIPETINDIAKLNRWLKTEENGLLIEASFDHVPVLQANQLTEAQAYKVINDYHSVLFARGAIDYFTWLKALDLPTTDKDKIKIWDLTPEQLAVIVPRLDAQQYQMIIGNPTNTNTQQNG